jgi:hypothetical protein
MKDSEFLPISFNDYISFENNDLIIKFPNDIKPEVEENHIVILNGKYPLHLLETDSTNEQIMKLW